VKKKFLGTRERRKKLSGCPRTTRRKASPFAQPWKRELVEEASQGRRGGKYWRRKASSRRSPSPTGPFLLTATKGADLKRSREKRFAQDQEEAKLQCGSRLV